QVDGAAHVGAFLVLVEIDRNHVHGVGMRHNVVSGLRNLAHDLAVPLGHDAGDNHGCLHALAGERVEYAKDAAPVTVFGKADGVEVGHSRLERIAHRTHSWPMTVRPAFECAAKKYRQTLPTGPAELPRQLLLAPPALYPHL